MTPNTLSSQLFIALSGLSLAVVTMLVSWWRPLAALRPFDRRQGGAPLRDISVSRDHRAIETGQGEGQRAGEQLRLALDLCGAEVWGYEIDGGDLASAKSTFANDGLMSALGYHPDDVAPDLVSRLRAVVLAEDQPRLQRLVRDCFAGRLPQFDAECRFVHKTGSIHWKLVRGIVARDGAGRPLTFMGSAVDITRLKHIESELSRVREVADAANSAKDELLAHVSHEIRTPMNAILGMTELALDSAPSEHQRRLLSTVRSAAKNLLTIINDLLDFSKMAAGKLALDCADFSVRDSVGDTLRALALRAHRKGLELLCHVRPDVPDALEGDAGRLRQVLMNLVGNAIEFTPRGEVAVDVAAEPAPASERALLLTFTVRDTGIGIASENQAAIFRAFEQEDSSTTRNHGGTGLGLTISAQLAALMGGGITLESVPGRGSTFRFSARFARSSRPGPALASSEQLTGLRVLVVDDNETHRCILAEWLSSWRMLPTVVGDAGAARAALAGAHDAGIPFALVLLDARMPDTDGATLAGQIKDRWGAEGPRLILLSSDDDAALLARSRRNGVVAYLLKPVQQSELLDAIGAVMNPDVMRPSTALSAQRPSARSRALRVLVAEDNELNVALLQELSSQYGHPAQFARDGHAALELALRGTFDLLLLDLHMPELDGFEVVRAIRLHELGTNQHLPIIALTARSSAHDRARCLAAGVDAFLPKPIEAAVLWAAVDGLVAGSPPARLGPRHGELALLDQRAVLRTFDGQASIFEKLLAVFRQCLPVQMSRVSSSLAAGDFVGLCEAAHQLVGTVGAFSSVTAGVAATLEDAAERQERGSCAALVEQLSIMCDALLVATAVLLLDSRMS